MDSNAERPMRHTVIMTSFNRPKLVRTAISSVLGQTTGDLQFLITDDGSNDETISSINNAIKNDNRCTLLTRERVVETEDKARPNCMGRAAENINKALDLVTGDIVHYLCDDDWYHPKRFETFESLMTKSEVLVAYGRLVYMIDELTPISQERYFEEVKDPLGVLDLNQVIHKSSMLKQVPKWIDDPGFASDGYFFRGLMNTAKRFYGIDKVVAYKRFHKYNMQHTMRNTTGKREE